MRWLKQIIMLFYLDIKIYIKNKFNDLLVAAQYFPKTCFVAYHLGGFVGLRVFCIDVNHYIFKVYLQIVYYESLPWYQILQFVVTIAVVIVIFTVTFNIFSGIVEKISGGKLPQIIKDSLYLFPILGFIVIFTSLTLLLLYLPDKD